MLFWEQAITITERPLRVERISIWALPLVSYPTLHGRRTLTKNMPHTAVVSLLLAM